MANRKVSLIEKGTAAGTASYFFPAGSVVNADGDLGSDEITFEKIGMNDADLTDAYFDGSALVLSATQPDFAIPYSMHLKITKPVTTNPVGVYGIE